MTEALPPATEAPRRETWAAYAYLCAVGFVMYAIGALTPYLRDDLGLSSTEAALHPSALAVGVMLAGWRVDAVERRLGRRRAGLLAAGVLAAGGLGVAFGPTLPVTVAGALAMGAGAGAILASVNLVLGRPGGARAEIRLARANLWSVLVAMQAPLLIAATATSPLGWRAVPLVAVIVPAALELAGGLPEAPSVGSRSGATSTAASRLSPAFWLAWLFVVAVVSIEFGYVVWGSSIVTARTGLSLESATALASLFLGGMVLGRLALSVGLVGRARSRRWLEVALLLAAAGGVVVWLAGDPVGSAVGLFAAGLGTATLYPQAIALALDRAGGAVLAAGARLTLASGTAILLAPLVLGAVADAVGVVASWPLVIGLCVAAFVLRSLTGERHDLGRERPSPSAA